MGEMWCIDVYIVVYLHGCVIKRFQAEFRFTGAKKQNNKTNLQSLVFVFQMWKCVNVCTTFLLDIILPLRQITN